MAKHEDLTDAHVPYRWSYADTATREAATGMAAGDVGKLALQEDNNTLWMLTDDDPVTWKILGSATAIHTDESGEINALDGKDTPVGADMVVIEDSEASNAKKKVLLSNLLKIITGLTEETTPEDEDLVLIQQAADGALRKVQVSNLPGGGGGGAPTDAKYIVSAADATLSQEVVIPGLAGSGDISGVGGAGSSEEYDSATTGLTWVSAPDTVNSNTQLSSHLYIKAVDGTERIGYKAWSPAGAFDARCKVSFGVGDIHFEIYNSDKTQRISFSVSSSSYNHDFYAQTYASSYTTRGSKTGIPSVPIYLRIVRDGSNNISWYFGFDGISWVLLVTYSFTITVASIGFRIGASGEYYIDWLRTDV